MERTGIYCSREAWHVLEMENQKNQTIPLKSDRITERLKAQARVLGKIAGECWNEETADKIVKLAQECNGASQVAQLKEQLVRAEWPPSPTFWKNEH
jgi:conjugal transfer/entry exclusion protein